MAASISLQTFLNSLNRNIEPPIQAHLKNVYSCMSLSLLAAAFGGYVHMFTEMMQGGILSALASIGFAIALYATPDNGKNRSTRLWYLLGLAFCAGLGLGPLMEVSMLVSPSIIPTAFLSTCFIFGCFSLCAMVSDQRRWLYLGGTLMSLLSLLLLMSLVNLFIGSRILYQVHLYLAFFVVCGFIIYDTALIIEKKRRGDDDYIMHSVLLFLDFIEIFRYLVIILTQKEQSKQKRSKNN